MGHATVDARRVEAVRRFNRFWTRTIGVLEEHLLHSPFTLAEARLVFEIAHDPGTTASQLTDALGLDAGYLSRLLHGLEDAGVVERTPAPEDARRMQLRLTTAGEYAFGELNAASREEIARLLATLTEDDQVRMMKAMTDIEAVLDARPEAGVPWVLRPPRAGDLGWVVWRHGALYGEEYGWDERFEGLVAEIVARFAAGHDPARERCWIAELEGQNIGCVFVVAENDTVARLRLLLVDPAARGRGVGARLVEECMRFARRAGYERMVLWTNDVLVSARRIYEAAGFELTEEKPHTSFGHDLVGQTWERAL